MFRVGQYVRLHTNDEWNGLYGIISEIVGNTISVFCIQIPHCMYYIDVNNENAKTIIEIIDV